jgi:hypothetical protein
MSRSGARQSVSGLRWPTRSCVGHVGRARHRRAVCEAAPHIACTAESAANAGREVPHEASARGTTWFGCSAKSPALSETAG